MGSDTVQRSPFEHALQIYREAAIKEYDENRPDRNITYTPLGCPVSREQLKHWNDYCEIFKSRWGLDKIICEYIALFGGGLFEAEYSEHGEGAYARSVCLPIRNANYQTAMIRERWPALREMGLATPLLDYGCGCGFLVRWLSGRGYKDLYAYEPPGIQREIMKEAFAGRDITCLVCPPTADKVVPDKFKTIICLNVLEHVEKPMEMLEYFYSMSNRVIADICIDKEEHAQGPHIAPKDELRECRKILIKRGSLFDIEPHTNIRDRIKKDYGPTCTN